MDKFDDAQFAERPTRQVQATPQPGVPVTEPEALAEPSVETPAADRVEGSQHPKEPSAPPWWAEIEARRHRGAWASPPTGSAQGVPGRYARSEQRWPYTEQPTQEVEGTRHQQARPSGMDLFTELPTLPEQVALWHSTSLNEQGQRTDRFSGSTQHEASWQQRTGEHPYTNLPTGHLQAQADQQARRDKSSRPVGSQKRGRRLISVFALLLVVLVISGVVLGPIVYMRVFASKSTARPSLQRILHPQTTVVHLSDVTNAANRFMQYMQQKNWAAMWSMLAPDAQSLWQNEIDFTHFEQMKFGAINFQHYMLGQAIASHPWLDPDTTQVYSSAVTLDVSLQASAPPGLLTTPSNDALNKGLFEHMLFAVTQDVRGNWQVLIPGPADFEAPILVPAKLPETRTTTSPTMTSLAPLGPVDTPPAHVILPVFMYHHVSSQPTRDLLDFSLTVTTAEFNHQLDWLQKQGYKSITMTELFDAFYYGKVLPSKAVMLTFDDGYTDVFTYAFPALLAHHYRGVFYIPSGLRNGWYMTWDQLRTLAKSGMEIADHTINHADLAQYPMTQHKTTPQQEILNSKTMLEQELGIPIQFFCYPYGEPFHHGTQAVRQIVLQDLFNDGYVGATLDPFALNSALQIAAQPYLMPRIRVSGGESMTAFMGVLKATLQADAARVRALG